MMKLKIIVLIFLGCLSISRGFGIDMDEIRANYTLSTKDKSLCKNMILELIDHPNKTALQLGYLGGLRSIWANHVFSPIEKLKTFKAGRNDIESAINKDPKSAELRFIRLSIQKNAPTFLGYKSNIKEDQEYIRNKGLSWAPSFLINSIEDLLKN